MTDNFSAPIYTEQPPKKKNTVWIIVGVVTLLLLCCCCSVVWAAWTYGDQIMSALGVTY